MRMKEPYEEQPAIDFGHKPYAGSGDAPGVASVFARLRRNNKLGAWRRRPAIELRNHPSSPSYAGTIPCADLECKIARCSFAKVSCDTATIAIITRPFIHTSSINHWDWGYDRAVIDFNEKKGAGTGVRALITRY
jgi:hypothetical protein